MNHYREAYKRLNVAQKQAVDATNGPVMVIAGPGTGKTQLLSVRVAHILQTTDTAPNNILCLTFTESAATAMQQRLAEMIGPDAYKVAIHTFHSFGSEIISQYPAYFYEGAHFRPASELSSFEVLQRLFSTLPHVSPLAKTMNGEFTMLPSVKQAISYLKKAGLSPDELRAILRHNQTFVDYAEPLITEVFASGRLSVKLLDKFTTLINELEDFKTTLPPLENLVQLSRVCIAELTSAVEDSTGQKTTKPLAAWRTRWLEYDHKRQLKFKDRTRSEKLYALADIYQQYISAMEQNELFDFDDMIMRTIRALETHPELRYNLQEQYLYIMVDEFQDTNGAQTRLINNLLDNPVHEGRPNIMVVGDDDQAIYAFQGAEVSNMMQFTTTYKDPLVVTLRDNYRSTDSILSLARQVITQAESRLETTLASVNKQLIPHNTKQPDIAELHQLETPTEQYTWVTAQIKQLIASGTEPNKIAILGRNHRHLLDILPHLHNADLMVNYERRNNLLETEHITALMVLVRVVTALGQQDFDEAEALLPMLLGYPFWGISTKALWQLSIKAYQENKLWLELMLESDDQLADIAEFLIIAGHQSLYQPLMVMLDILIGSQEAPAAPFVTDSPTPKIQPPLSTSSPVTTEDPVIDPFLSWIPNQVWNDVAQQKISMSHNFQSPFRAYYFGDSTLQTQPDAYLTRLNNLKTMYRALQEYRPDQFLMLNDFVEFIDLHIKTKLPLVDTSTHHEALAAIQLMTAHKAKGLEFDAVFVLDAKEQVWGNGARRRHSSINFPHNLLIEPAGQNLDDCLRLFFVAMTRAKNQLYLCDYRFDDAGKNSPMVSFLQTEALKVIGHTPSTASAPPGIPRSHPGIPAEGDNGLRRLLEPQLANYKLSATHLNNFIDITNGGPQTFLLQNLLHFPQAMSVHNIFGSAIHKVLQRAHNHLTSSDQRRPVEDILHDFELHLQNSHLSDIDFTHWLEKGSDVLQNYLEKRYSTFTVDQKSEYPFASQGVIIDGVRLTGNIDLLEIDQKAKTITVIDYKTGKPATSWQGKDDYQKVKLHKYRQQLMLYKLLVENSRTFGGKYTVPTGIIEFIEPGPDGDIQRLEFTFEPEELDRFRQLLKAVWDKIIILDLPDVSGYSANYAGLIEFEKSLLSNTI